MAGMLVDMAEDSVDTAEVSENLSLFPTFY